MVDGCLMDVGCQGSPNVAGAEDQGEAGGWGFFGAAHILEEPFGTHEAAEADDAASGEDSRVGCCVEAKDVAAGVVDQPGKKARRVRVVGSLVEPFVVER